MDRTLKGVLFDLDGTLLDTHDLLLATFRFTVREVLGEAGEAIPDEVLMAKVGQPLVVQMWDFTDDEATHDELMRVYREHNALIHDDMVRAFPGAVQTLSALRDAGLALGVVTSKRHAPALHGLSLFGLDGFFECLVGADDWPEHKPQPGPVARGCELLGIDARSCAYVGDSPFDMQAGGGAGCLTVAARWGMFPAEVLEEQHPHLRCDALADLPALLLGDR